MSKTCVAAKSKEFATLQNNRNRAMKKFFALHLYSYLTRTRVNSHLFDLIPLQNADYFCLY